MIRPEDLPQVIPSDLPPRVSGPLWGDQDRTYRVESPGLSPRTYTVPRETPCPETLRRVAAWLAWEAGMAWVCSDEFPISTWRDDHATRLSRIALRAIDAAQPGRYLWRREWAWTYYAEMNAPKVAQEGTR